MPAIQDHGSSGSGRGGFPGLGFDPTPGNVEAVIAVTDGIRTARARLDECAPRLAEAIKVADDWKGPAADDFHRFGDDLPKGMTAGAQSMGITGTVLTAWAGQMSANQREADALEAAAKQFKRQLEHAEGDLRNTASRAAYAHGSDRAPAERAATAARQEYDRIAGLLEEIMNEARRLQRRHLSEAKAVANAVRGKSEGAFTPVQVGGAAPIFDKAASVVDSVGDFGTHLAQVALTRDVNALAKDLDTILPGGRNVAKAIALGALSNPLIQTNLAGAGVGLNLAAGQVKPFIGLGQFASGSARGPRWWELGIDLALTKVPIKGARGLVRGAAESALFGATRREIAKESGKLGLKRAKEAVGDIAGVQQFRKAHEILERRQATGSLTEALSRKHDDDLLQKGASALGGHDATAKDLIKHRAFSEEELRAAGERAVIREYLAKAAEGVLPGEAGKVAGIVIDPQHLDKATDYGQEKVKEQHKKDED